MSPQQDQELGFLTQGLEPQWWCLWEQWDMCLKGAGTKEQRLKLWPVTEPIFPLAEG